MPPLETIKLTPPGAGQVDVKDGFEPNQVGAAQDCHMRTKICRLINVVGVKKNGHAVFARDAEQQPLHHQVRLRIEGNETARPSA